MKYIVAFILGASIIFTSCVSETNEVKQKKYSYVETVRSRDLYGGYSIEEEEAQNIMAASDTLAYIDAFENFCISQKVYRDMYKKGVGDYIDEPLSFKLYNEAGEDITYISFVTKKQREAEIVAEFEAMGNVLDDGWEREEVRSQVDSVKMKELLPYFNVVKDEFDPKGTTWYKPKSAPNYVRTNGLYMYFGVQDNKVLYLRFRIQYYADDWLFFRKVQFSIDDKAYEFIPIKTETDHGGGMIWEWFDETLTGSDSELIYALANAQSAKMKLIGRQYYDIIHITPQQTLDIKRSLELYNAMGGTY